MGYSITGVNAITKIPQVVLNATATTPSLIGCGSNCAMPSPHHIRAARPALLHAMATWWNWMEQGR